MAIDTQQKRMSAMNLSCPWRGPMVVPTGSASQAIRQAADFMYSGVLAGELSTVVARLFFATTAVPGAATVDASIPGAYAAKARIPGVTEAE